MPAIDLSVLCIPAECDNIKLPIECEIASRWDAYLLFDICRHFASVMLHFASLISHNLRCIPAYAHQIPMGFFQSLLNYHMDNLYIISFFFGGGEVRNNEIWWACTLNWTVSIKTNILVFSEIFIKNICVFSEFFSKNICVAWIKRLSLQPKSGNTYR